MLYPPIEPYRQGTLDTGDGHQIYWGAVRQPTGQAGGIPAWRPGQRLLAGAPPAVRPAPLQRAAVRPARLRPLAAARQPGKQHHPGTWWPTSSACAPRSWAPSAGWCSAARGARPWRWLTQTHPQRASELVVRGIFGLRRAEVQWFYQEGASWLFPDRWEEYVAPIPPEERGDLIAAYHRRLTGDDPAEQLRAAKAWSRWEDHTITLLPSPRHQQSHAADRAALAFARIENHYFVHAGFMEEGQLIRDAHKLHGIPGTIVQGRYDVCTPARTAWDLHRAWPQAQFHLIPDAGHAFDEPGILARLIQATDTYAANPA